MVLDDVLPNYDFQERHSTRIAATPEAALAAARDTTGREVPLFVVLMALRGLPALLMRRTSLRLDRPMLEGFRRMGFAVAAETDDEIVVVGVGRFWRLDGDLRPITPDEFERFSVPGYVKTAFHFRVAPNGGGCELATETRILATDAGARRSFGRYWRMIRPGSGAIRRDWLRAIRRRAEEPR